MTADELKKKAAEAALAHIEPRLERDTVLGVGTGSTVNHFIAALGGLGGRIDAAVSSSEESSRRLAALGIRVVDLNSVGGVDVYVDGADEANRHLQLIKGGGAALTREKIIAAAAREFVCIADESKLVAVLGRFPLPVEVIPMARSHVARKIAALGGRPVYRENVVTDNGNEILDIHGLDLRDPRTMEARLDAIAGVVCNGLFVRRPADRLLLAGGNGVRTLLPSA
ncbi:MAG: ribose-5-phosphate isomerase RpiA [Gammaproteobacteria bacterium]|nr:ribose-5-phosphate isomerase RpiA [Gammaproteobacteria bacterium]